MNERLGPIPRVTLTRAEAAASLGMSTDSFERHVQRDLRIIRCGRLRLVAVTELQRWADEKGQHVLER
jgi:hypothetical protein